MYGRIFESSPSSSIEIIKQDKDTQSLTTTGDGTLDGAIYDLLDQDRNIVGTFVTGKKNLLSSFLSCNIL